MLQYLVMHIYFIGQAARIEVLAQEAVKNGHRVTLTSTPYTALSCIYTLFIKSDTIHVHGWKAGIVLRTLTFLLPNTAIIWTISSVPEFSHPFLQLIFQRFLPFIAEGFDSICTPSRTVQYRLLTLYNLKSEYIPDGYYTPILTDIRPAVYGLRKEQYGVVFAKDSAELQHIAKTYKDIRTRQKLVLFTNRTHTGFTSIDLPLMSRGAQSLVRQAGFVVAADPTCYDLALQAMDTGRTIIATTDSLHEELFGTTAKYYQENDSTQLQKLLQEALKKKTINTHAQIRAKNHFSWDKTGQEYMRTYRHSKAILVPFDSIVAKNSFPIAI